MWLVLSERKALTAGSTKEGSGQRKRSLTELEPLLEMGMSLKIENASWEREEGESSSRMGISRRNRGCLSFLSFGEASLGLLRGLRRQEERQVLAWRMASSLEAGVEEGEGREEQKGAKKRVLVVDSLLSRGEWRESDVGK